MHHSRRNPLATGFADHWAVMRCIGRESPVAHNAVGHPISERHGSGGDWALFFTVAICPPIAAGNGLHSYGKFVNCVGGASGVHPTGVLVKALVDEKLPPRRRAIGIQPLAAGHLLLGAEVKAGVRIYQQQRMAAGAVRRCDYKAVGPSRLARYKAAFFRGQRDGAALVKGLQLSQGNAAYIAADGTFRKTQRHPWLEPRQHLGLHVWMVGQILIETCGPSLHQLFEPRRTLGIVGLQFIRIDPQPLTQVLPQRLFAFSLS